MVLKDPEKMAEEAQLVLLQNGITGVVTLSSGLIRISIPGCRDVTVEYQRETIFVSGRGRFSYSEFLDIAEETVQHLGFECEFFYEKLQTAVRQIIASAENQSVPVPEIDWLPELTTYAELESAALALEKFADEIDRVDIQNTEESIKVYLANAARSNARILRNTELAKQS